MRTKAFTKSLTFNVGPICLTFYDDMTPFIYCIVGLDRCAPCKSELRKLIGRKQEMYNKTTRAREMAEQAAWGPHIPPPGWRLKGTLVAHLHEHRSSVNK